MFVVTDWKTEMDIIDKTELSSWKTICVTLAVGGFPHYSTFWLLID